MRNVALRKRLTDMVSGEVRPAPRFRAKYPAWVLATAEECKRYNARLRRRRRRPAGPPGILYQGEVF